MAAKDAEIVELKSKLLSAVGTLPAEVSRPVSLSDKPTREPLPSLPGVTVCDTVSPRRGKAPPVNPFSGDSELVRFDDWLPASWNGWSDEGKLLQFAGHLPGWALQEWNLIPQQDRTTYDDAVMSLRSRVKPENRVLAGQDFRHATQENSESVVNYV